MPEFKFEKKSNIEKINGFTQEELRKLEKQDKILRGRIGVQLKNERLEDQMNQFIKYSIVEFLEEIPLGQGKEAVVDDMGTYELLRKNKEEGYYVQSIPVYGENGEVVAHKYYRAKPEILIEKAEVKNQIEEKAEDRYHNAFQKEQETLDQEYKNEVKKGEMEFLGELSDDEYVNLRKTGTPFSLLRKVVLFDEDGNYISDKAKYFLLKKS